MFARPRQRELSIWLAPFVALGRSANPAFGLAGINFIAGTGNLVLSLRRSEFKGMQAKTIAERSGLACCLPLLAC